MISADALRKAWDEHARFLPVEPVMTLTENGLVLGAGAVLAKWCCEDGAAGLAIDGAEERLLALLAVAYGQAVPPSIIGNIRRATRDWNDGNRCPAFIHLARSGLPTLEEDEAAPFRLFAADRLLQEGIGPRRLLELLDIDGSGLDLLKDDFDSDEPRVPAGSPDGGQWTDGGENGIVPAAARQSAQNAFPADKDPFFDTLYAPVHDVALRLGIDESWLLGLAAHEGGWLEQPHNREINNPFGVTHAGGRDVHYGSIDDAVAAWEQRYGPVVRGATSAADFVQRLLVAHYNVVTKEWASQVTTVIRSVQRRLGSWKSRHGL